MISFIEVNLHSQNHVNFFPQKSEYNCLVMDGFSNIAKLLLLAYITSMIYSTKVAFLDFIRKQRNYCAS